MKNKVEIESIIGKEKGGHFVKSLYGKRGVFKIFFVDKNCVKCLDKTFEEYGHSGMFNFIPCTEIWIDRFINKEFIHEIINSILRERGY